METEEVVKSKNLIDYIFVSYFIKKGKKKQFKYFLILI